jgi:hypothetical protein
MKEQIKELRVQIDGLAQLTKELKPIAISNDLEKAFTDFLVFGETEYKVKFYNSKEINKAYDSLILAKAWLGKVLGELGETNITADVAVITPGLREPFTGKDNLLGKSITCIDAWELNGINMNFYSDFNHIEKVHWLIKEFTKVGEYWDILTEDIGKLENYSWQIRDLSSYFVQHFSEAGFWLEFELGRIKNNDNPS